MNNSNDRYKRIIRYMSGTQIEDYYKGKVESIIIKLHVTYSSFAGTKESNYGFKRTKRDVADFFISCPNPECTEGYIDLRNHVDDAIRNQLTSAHGVTTCCGKTAPDHPNQNCESQVEYSIEVQYTQS